MDQKKEYSLSRWYTFAWGAFCIIVAQFAGQIGQSLIEAVNVLGSLFYGVILGIFLVAFYFKRIKAKEIFTSALVVQLYIILSATWPWLSGKLGVDDSHLPKLLHHFLNGAAEIGFLWLNAIGAIGVVLGAALLSYLRKNS